MATEAMLSEFDYFQPLSIQASVVNEYDDPILPSSTTEGRNVLVFVIPGSHTSYRDLSNSLLVLSCKVTNANGTNLANDAAVSPVNNLLHSLFTSVDITLCGTTITDKQTHYPYRAFIETLLTYDTDVHNMRSVTAGWIPDENGEAMDRILLANADDGTTPNAAFLERRKQIAGSRSVTLIGRIHADLFHQNLDIPPDCDIVVTLTPSSDAFALIAANDATFKISVSKACLQVRTKVVTPELLMSHRDMLDKCNFRLPYTKVQMHEFVIPPNTLKCAYSNIFPDKLPKRIIIGLVSQARTQATYEVNPYKFENFGLTEIELTVNGQALPKDKLSMNFATNDYTRAYVHTLDALNLGFGNRAISMTPTLWASCYNFYAFKLVPGPIDCSSMLYMLASATVNLSITLSAGVANPISVLIYSETPSLIEITKLNTVLMS